MIPATDNEIRVELKYCERCGGLWFRRENSCDTFCAPCTQRLDETLSPPSTAISAIGPDFGPGLAPSLLAEPRKDGCISGGAA